MKKLFIIQMSLILIILLSITGCFPQDTSESNPYSVRVYDTSSNASPIYVHVSGITTDNATIAGTAECNEGSITDMDGIIVGNGSSLSAVTQPSGDIVGTSESQELTNKQLGATELTGTLDVNVKTLDDCYVIDGFSVLPLTIRSSKSSGGCIYIQTYNSGSAQQLTRLSFDGGVDTGIAQFRYCNIDIDNNYLAMEEMTAPGAGSTNYVRIYALEGAGDALTDLCAVYQDGTVDVFSQETTPLDAPQFRYASGTEVKMVMLKPHAGLVQYAYLFPDGTKHILREIQYHSIEKIEANKNCEGELPENWYIEPVKEKE